MHAKLVKELGEDVELRLAHSAARQPRANSRHRCALLQARKTCQSPDVAAGIRGSLDSGQFSITWSACTVCMCLYFQRI
jgi:hypothetical protein